MESFQQKDNNNNNPIVYLSKLIYVQSINNERMQE